MHFSVFWSLKFALRASSGGLPARLLWRCRRRERRGPRRADRAPAEPLQRDVHAVGDLGELERCLPRPAEPSIRSRKAIAYGVSITLFDTLWSVKKWFEHV